jgi:hypothetical protein
VTGPVLAEESAEVELRNVLDAGAKAAVRVEEDYLFVILS